MPCIGRCIHLFIQIIFTMKYFFLGATVLVSVLSACNNGSTDKAATVTSDSSSKVPAAPDTTASSAAKQSGRLKGVVAGYLQMKNALTGDDDKGAAAAGAAVVKNIDGLDTTGLTPEQSKALADVKDDTRENAKHISKGIGKLDHQREHFDMLSQDMYRLVKTFGAGQLLYYDHCPMYNRNKGADWLSETKEIKNPYLGKVMPTCGSEKEELK